jgi:transposase
MKKNLRLKATKGRLKRSKGRNLAERLKKQQRAVHAFAFEQEVPFTNNQAERDIRPAKVKQKISGCFRTTLGADTYARVQAVISTLRKREGHPFQALQDLFARTKVIIV